MYMPRFYAPYTKLSGSVELQNASYAVLFFCVEPQRLLVSAIVLPRFRGLGGSFGSNRIIGASK